MTTEKKSRLASIDLNLVVANILRFGVVISATVIVLGVAIELLNRQLGFPSSLNQLIQLNYGKPTLSLITLLSGIASLKGGFIIQLGLIILLATPIVRVGASILLFAAEKDLIYVVVTLFVLAVLLISIFIVGPIEAG